MDQKPSHLARTANTAAALLIHESGRWGFRLQLRGEQLMGDFHWTFPLPNPSLAVRDSAPKALRADEFSFRLTRATSRFENLVSGCAHN